MIRLGIIGTGMMGNLHAKAYSAMPGVAMKACCDVNEERAKSFAANWGIPAVYSDFRQMVDQESLDGVVNVTPDSLHAPIALAVLARRIHLFSEKPLATSLAQARRMRDAAQRSGVTAMVNFTYRNYGAIQGAAKFIADGHIGRTMHVEASYLQSWLVQPAWGDWRKDPGWQWRLSTAHGSAGVLGDLGCHIYDAVGLLCGEISELYCRLGTFDKGVKGNRIGPYTLDANDSFVSTIKLAGGGIGTVHASRWATGNMDRVRIRVFGDRGAVDVDTDRSKVEFLAVKGRADAMTARWSTVKVPPQPTNFQRFVRSIRTGKSDPSNFSNGTRVQAYLHCSFESAAKGRPVKVSF